MFYRNLLSHLEYFPYFAMQQQDCQEHSLSGEPQSDYVPREQIPATAPILTSSAAASVNFNFRELVTLPEADCLSI